jgi:ABC-type polysaccharide transport system permease subunit
MCLTILVLPELVYLVKARYAPTLAQIATQHFQGHNSAQVAAG